MKLKKGFVLRDVCGDKVIVGEGLEVIDFGRLLSLNETATYLWQTAESLGNFTPEELVAALCRDYNVTPDVAQKDVTTILKKWQEIGLTESCTLETPALDYREHQRNQGKYPEPYCCRHHKSGLRPVGCMA